jgi:hypothetical protein
MDQARQIRFLIPPFFLFLFLIWAAHLSGWKGIADLTKDGVKLLGAAAVAILPLGYAISVLSVLILKLLCIRPARFEAGRVDLNALWPALKMKAHLKAREKDRLYIVATFDHDYLPTRLHEWLRRRWNSVMVSANSAVAMILSIPIAYALGIEVPWKDWWFSLPFALLLLALIAMAFCARRETFQMLAFQAGRRELIESKR